MALLLQGGSNLTTRHHFTFALNELIYKIMKLYDFWHMAHNHKATNEMVLTLCLDSITLLLL